jgi:pectate lyase
MFFDSPILSFRDARGPRTALALALVGLLGCGSSSSGSGATGGTAMPDGSATGAGGSGGAAGEIDAAAPGDAAATGDADDAGAMADSGQCAESPPPPGDLVGWASTNGGTTGGGTATPITVTTLAELNAAVVGTAPAVIYVTAVLVPGTVNIGSNKTIVGLCGAEIHGHVNISTSANVILRNIKIVGYDCTDAGAISAHQCASGLDAVTVINGAHNLWFDHLDVSDGSDGNLDITNGSDFVTVSWTKFSYSTARADVPGNSDQAPESGHRFSNLIGASDATLTDAGKLNVTWHHDWWADNVAERMPRTRFGKIHLFNNLFTAAGNSYCTNAGIQASLLVENSIYSGVDNPLEPDPNGDMLARGNIFPNSTGTTTATGMGFVPPYAYALDDTTDLQAAIMAQAGPR